MQKKYLNSILGLGVVVIWGILGYTYFKKMTPNLQTTSVVNDYQFDLDLNTKRGDFVLTSIVRDPFLNQVEIQPATEVLPIISDNMIEKLQENTPVIWPKITYLGYVKSKNNPEKLGLMRLQKNFCKVRLRQKIKAIEVVAITQDSIGLRYQKELKYFSK